MERTDQFTFFKSVNKTEENHCGTFLSHRLGSLRTIPQYKTHITKSNGFLFGIMTPLTLSTTVPKCRSVCIMVYFILYKDKHSRSLCSEANTLQEKLPLGNTESLTIAGTAHLIHKNKNPPRFA